ncbi:transporter substrate-binding domain-containing protein [Pseudovibrio sp. Tun.PSC04-5.I4]|uniref:transporter substrate-binding domain-containing protein n=1 Tax=Pseudovibrio sp. Tun.PSC04-5.I4 TaxID=1798213 RepID=UPI0008853020|nr:transporter substrate-binding domain-containing protein [Pseudovibrio sp. Tun.PSC04-5.I4]SDQ33042.1 polar amino acid transport system substrate-binding protein [Pseudovibrio sp. Tun.PSC04-5.I4]SDR45308.1 amino acid ABC transporter substrate-binding protein, PAAT family [Pseudovibrio sp. Tun.PSC04-5.I4]
MKLKSFIAGAVGSAVIALASTASWAESTMEKIVRTGQMTIAVQTQGPPISFVNKNGDRAGLAIEIAQMMADDMAVELVIKDFDWKGLIPALLSGKADFIAADMTPTAKRHMQIVFTNPVFYSETVAFTPMDSPYSSWEELNTSDVSVATTQASSWAETARKVLPKAQLKEFAGGTAQTVQAVASGRANAGLSDTATIAGFISSIGGLKVLDGKLAREPLGFATRPDSLHLLSALDNYVRLIEADGRLEDRLDYWWNSIAWEADHK